jgi:hypothetical protein
MRNGVVSHSSQPGAWCCVVLMGGAGRVLKKGAWWLLARDLFTARASQRSNFVHPPSETERLSSSVRRSPPVRYQAKSDADFANALRG